MLGDRHILLSYGGLLRDLMSGVALPVVVDAEIDDRDPTIPTGAVPWKGGPPAAMALAARYMPPERIARFEWRAVTIALRGTETFPGWIFERAAIVAVPGDPQDEPVPLLGSPEALASRLPAREDRFAAAGHPPAPGHRGVDEIEELKAALASNQKASVTLGDLTVIRLSGESVAIMRGPLGREAADPLLRRSASVEMIIALARQDPPVDRAWAEGLLGSVERLPRADARISEAPDGLRLLEGLTPILSRRAT